MKGEKQRGRGGATAATVTAAARLHLGFLDLNGGLGRRFGGMGVGLQAPVTTVCARHGEGVTLGGVHLDAGERRRIIQMAHALLGHFRIAGGVDIHIKARIPPHHGLGSGTQLALALGTAVTALHGVDAAAADIAEATGRGARSGAGLGVFQHGGFVLDSGKGAGQSLPTLVAHHDFPEEWRLVLALDERGGGLSGARERQAFAALPDMPAAAAAETCRLALMQTLPALIEKDCRRFGQSLSAIQARCGEYFKEAQGGLFASAAVRRAVDFLLDHGAAGGGQTSWGPTGFAVFANDAAARDAMDAFARRPGDAGGATLRLVQAENRRARVRVRRR